MSRALARIFPTEKAEALTRLLLEIEPERHPGDPDYPPQDASHSPEAVRRSIRMLVGEEGLGRLRAAAEPPQGVDLTYHGLTHPLYAWWPYLKDLR